MGHGAGLLFLGGFADAKHFSPGSAARARFSCFFGCARRVARRRRPRSRGLARARPSFALPEPPPAPPSPRFREHFGSTLKNPCYDSSGRRLVDSGRATADKSSRSGANSGRFRAPAGAIPGRLRATWPLLPPLSPDRGTRIRATFRIKPEPTGCRRLRASGQSWSRSGCARARSCPTRGRASAGPSGRAQTAAPGCTRPAAGALRASSPSVLPHSGLRARHPARLRARDARTAHRLRPTRPSRGSCRPRRSSSRAQTHSDLRARRRRTARPPRSQQPDRRRPSARRSARSP